MRLLRRLGERVGLMLERYELVRELGRGASGVVFLARDKEDGCEVALKELFLGGAITEERAAEAVARFEREADTASKLMHPNVVRVLGSFSEDDRHFIVMERIDGETLSEVLERGPLPVEAAVGVVGQLLEALVAANAQGVIHRDLKPDNVFVLDDGTIKVSDFGIAHIEGDEAGLTRAGQVLGTVGYMSPEQIKGDPVDSRTDLFSVGVILHQMLTGQNPFGAEHPTTMMYRISYEEPPDLQPLVSALPAHVAPIVRKALAKDASLRYQSAEAMLGDLRQGLAPDTVAIEEAAAERARAREQAQAPPEVKQTPFLRRRWKPIVAGLLVAVLAGAGLVGFSAYRASEDEEEAAKRAAILEEGALVFESAERLERLEGRMVRLVDDLLAKANRNEQELAAWDAEWTSRQQAYDSRVAVVEEHNRQERQLWQGSYEEEWDWWNWEWVGYYTYTPSYWTQPDYPDRPAKVTCDVSSEIGRIEAIAEDLEMLRSAVTSEAVSSAYYLVVYEAINGALDSLETALADIREATENCIQSDPEKGDVVQAAMIEALDLRFLRDPMDKVKAEYALYLANYGLSNQDIEAALPGPEAEAQDADAEAGGTEGAAEGDADKPSE